MENILDSWDKKENIYITGVPAADLHFSIGDFGFVIDTDTMDINGWDGDYWVKVRYEDNVYSLRGNFFYGTHSISREDNNV